MKKETIPDDIRKIFTVDHVDCLKTSEDLLEDALEWCSPLQLSIYKWKFIVETLNERKEKIYQVGAKSCALCHEFLSKDCKGCPVLIKTGRKNCEGTPFVEYLNAPHEKFKVVLRAAKKEVKFLESLLAKNDEN